jgi:hypothetical protein
MFLGQERVGWEDIFACNLHVDIQRNGQILVKRLPVCGFFIRNYVAVCAACQRLGIESSVAS